MTNHKSTQPIEVQLEIVALTKKTTATRRKSATQASAPTDTLGKTPPAANTKEIATAANEPWVGVIDIELDIDNIGNGAFELDWNDVFIARLVKAGYQGKTDIELVDQWFRSVCKNVLAENFEQWVTNQPLDIRTAHYRNLGGGKTEIS